MNDLQPIINVAPSNTYREGMSRVVGAVHIVTTGGQAGDAGFTATAVTSVSDKPPTVLVCMSADSRSLPVLQKNGTFCINTLCASDEQLANIFAGRTGVYGVARFEHGSWHRDMNQNPVLKEPLVAFSCRVTLIQPAATHVVIFGEVVEMMLAERQDKLLKALAYQNRHYITI
jgi:flavin reductase